MVMPDGSIFEANLGSFDEPTNERKRYLQEEGKQRARGKPPYDGVKILTRGELEWVVKQENWSGAIETLHRACLSGVDLSGVNLTGIVLNGVDFSRANLRGVNLRGAQLNGADFTGASAGYADLRDAQLEWAEMNRCSLEGATLD